MTRLPRLRPILELLGDALWVRPVIAMALGLVLGLTLPELEVTEGPLRWSGDGDDARDLLLQVLTTTLMVTATAFGFIIVALQVASTQFSPRSLRSFVRDRWTQTALAVLMSVVAYGTGVLVRVEEGGSSAPVVAMTVTMWLVLVVGLTLVFLIHHTAQSIRIERLMAVITGDTLEALAHRPRDDNVRSRSGAAPTPPQHAQEIPAKTSGYVDEIDLDALAELAEAHGVVIAMRLKAGEHVIERLPLAWTWRSDGDPVGEAELAELAEGVGGAVSLGVERTMEQDIAFGPRQLVDIALRAMSPAINDPRTAVEATKHLSRILCAMADEPLQPLVRCDDRGTPRVMVPAVGFDGYLDLACDQIRRFGSREPAVSEALLTLLAQVAMVGPSEERRALLHRHVDLVEEGAEHEVAQTADLEHVRARAAAVREIIDGRRPTVWDTVAP
jgi:uncharacterized membrane protein